MQLMLPSSYNPNKGVFVKVGIKHNFLVKMFFFQIYSTETHNFLQYFLLFVEHCRRIRGGKNDDEKIFTFENEWE